MFLSKKNVTDASSDGLEFVQILHIHFSLKSVMVAHMNKNINKDNKRTYD